jgi:hypothetical protein
MANESGRGGYQSGVIIGASIVLSLLANLLVPYFLDIGQENWREQIKTTEFRANAKRDILDIQLAVARIEKTLTEQSNMYWRVISLERVLEWQRARLDLAWQAILRRHPSEQMPRQGE